MPRAITKHRIPMEEAHTIRHQRMAPVAHFGIVEGNAFIWVEENTEIPRRRTTYRTFSTDEEIPDGWAYVTSAQDPLTGISAHLYKES